MNDVLDKVEGLEVNEVPDGYIVYDTAQEQVHFLNATGVLVFELCNGRHTQAAIVDKVANAYDVGGDQSAVRDIEACLAALVEQGLVTSSTKS